MHAMAEEQNPPEISKININSTSVNGDEDSSEDDFGNFSDASFETEQEEKGNQLDIFTSLNELLPDTININDSNSKCGASLQDLISEERPHVIYQQLVQVRSMLRPFIWKKSQLKANVWHILNIPQEESLERQLKQEPLDDLLFMQIQPLINDNALHTGFILKDHFKINYCPVLTPTSIQDDEERDQEKEIPEYLKRDLNSVEDPRKYHDALCHAIDVLFVELQNLKKRELDLVKDKATFENVVTNLTGHTQRLYRDEIAFYNKKVKHKSRFIW